jgi:hypothetical protein
VSRLEKRYLADSKDDIVVLQFKRHDPRPSILCVTFVIGPRRNEFVSTVRSIQELIDHVHALTSKNNLRWLFRGHSDARWSLRPAVYRGGYGTEEERYLTQEFRARAGLRHSHRPRYEDYADWLALMQHYGLPTRLLDWSHSPLTAAFFAVEPTLNHLNGLLTSRHDATIWAVCPGVLNETQGLKRYIYPLNSGELTSLVEAAFYPANGTFSVAAAMAIETDVRMQVQRGAFTIHGTDEALEKISGCDEWLQQFVIPANEVGALGVDVQTLGLGLADLFPDLGSLARDLASRIRRKL